MFKSWILCTLLCLSAGAAEMEGRPGFVLMALDPPPAVGSLYSSYAEAGLNTIALGQGAGLETAVELAASRGLSVMLANPPACEEPAQDWAALAEKHDAVAGWLLADAAPTEDWDRILKQAQELHQLNPRRQSMVLFEARAEGAAEAIDGLLTACPCMFGLRTFTMKEDGTWDRAQFFSNLLRSRTLSEKHRVPWVGFVQVTESGAYRFASESDLRIQVYANLAFGAGGLAYHRYWLPISKSEWDADPAAGMRRTMVNPRTGERHYTWEKVAEVNKEVKVLWPTLATLKVEETFFAGKEPPEGMTALPFGKRIIRSVTAQSALVSFMRDADGGDWVFLVNGVHGMQRSAKATERTLRLVLDKRVVSIDQVNRLSGEREAVEITRNEVYITLPGGTGTLLRLNVLLGKPAAQE